MAFLGWGLRQYVQQRKEHYVYKKPEKNGTKWKKRVACLCSMRNARPGGMKASTQPAYFTCMYVQV